MAFQSPRIYYEYIGSGLISSFAFLEARSLLLLNSMVGYREGQSISKDASPLHRYTPQKDKGEKSEIQQENQTRHFPHESE